jgi:hypothetical protein
MKLFRAYNFLWINTHIKSSEIIQFLVKTAEKTDAGPIVNPKRFLGEVSNMKRSSQ